MILLILTLKCRTLLYMSKDTALSTFQSAATNSTIFGKYKKLKAVLS